MKLQNEMIFLRSVKMQMSFISTYSVIVFRFNVKPSNFPIVEIVSSNSPNWNWRRSQKCIFHGNFQDRKWVFLLQQNREKNFLMSRLYFTILLHFRRTCIGSTQCKNACLNGMWQLYISSDRKWTTWKLINYHNKYFLHDIIFIFRVLWCESKSNLFKP